MKTLLNRFHLRKVVAIPCYTIITTIAESPVGRDL